VKLKLQHIVHTGITIVLIVATSIVILILAAKATDVPAPSVLLGVFVTGTLGGVINNYRRLQKLPLVGSDETLPIRLITFQIYLSPVVAGVFSVILYGLFMANILQGELFPEFSEEALSGAYQNEVRNGLHNFMFAAVPATHLDVAKALVWSFIAGFVENFVPNFIDKIAKTAAESKTADSAELTA
jgi:small-conductance mechanosensitive channel